MIIQVLAIIITVLLIFTNGMTDAPNAIATLIGSKVMSFKKASIISAIFNFIGIIVMSFVNISVADCISSMVRVSSGVDGILVLISAMLSVIIFALVAMQFGIPTSETHGLVAGLTGSAIAVYGFEGVNGKEWINVGVGLVWSILGAFLLSMIIGLISKKALKNVKDKTVGKFQIFGMCAMSFMRGAQDGQKFIGILVIYNFIVQGLAVPEFIAPMEHLLTIVFVAFVMFVGVCIGGEKIVENIGSNVTNLSQKQALSSDIATAVTLFCASLNGLPVSTTHVKTMSIIGVGKCSKQPICKKAVVDIVKAWVLTFPVCLVLSFVLAKIFVIF
ncbi:MAG: inorganic phosphate transporter [Clostridia bacterium]|nr:inorganic phosphate transporter [Clostridia bacterium]